jgi:hypothetical protein
MSDNAPANVVTPKPSLSSQKTVIGFRTDMTISGEKVSIDAVIGEDFFVQLNQEASLGTPIGFAYWLKETYAVEGEGIDVLTLPEYPSGNDFQMAYAEYKKKDATNADKNAFEAKIKQHLTSKNIPAAALEIMMTALLAEVLITDLLLQIKSAPDGEVTSKKFKFGLAIRFSKPLSLLPNIYVDQLTLRVLSAPRNDFTFPTPVKALEEPAETAVEETDSGKPAAVTKSAEGRKARGTMTFNRVPAADSVISLKGTDWTFVATAPTQPRQTQIGPDPVATVANLVRDLSESDDPNITACTYAADKNVLIVEAANAGPAGNLTKLLVKSPSANAVVSAMRGGVGPTKASGTVIFKQKPKTGATVVLNGVTFTFSADGSGTNEVKIEPKTTGCLANFLTKVKSVATTDADLKGYDYVASDGTLTITAKEAGEAGNDFTLVAEPASVFEIQAATLLGGC